MKRNYKKFYDILIVCGAICCLIRPRFAQEFDSIEVDGNKQSIFSLNGHCNDKYCYDFHYNNINDYAYFDVKAEVRIGDDSTYDIIQPTRYDSLIFVNSTFVNFPLNLFRTFTIQELDMRNCSIKYLNETAFSMANHLKVLLLSENKINSIEANTFKFANKLQFLFLDSNQIQTLYKKSFQNLNMLKYIDLSNNFITQLPQHIFDNMPWLDDINLSNNQIEYIGNNLFENNPRLHMIKLNNNQLKEIEEYTFNNQKNLKLLDISHNRYLGALVINLKSLYLVANNCSLYRINIYGAIEHVEMRDNQILELYFSQPEAIVSLNLRNNALQQIASLARAKKLYELDLSDNPALKNLPDHWLTNALGRIYISNTNITTLPIPNLNDKEHIRLQYLNISHNKITHIDPRVFIYLQHLTHFYIDNNNWDCFNLRMLMDMVIIPYRIMYTQDKHNEDFVGEYINGISCMYHLNHDAESKNNNTRSEEYLSHNQIISMPKVTGVSPELEDLQGQLKVLSNFFEKKFDLAFKKIDDLNARLNKFELLNATIWNHVTIST